MRNQKKNNVVLQYLTLCNVRLDRAKELYQLVLLRKKKWVWLLGAVIVLIAGFKAPPYFIDTGISRFSGEIERGVAANSITSAHMAMSDTFGALLATAYRVTEVTPALEPCDGSPNMFKPAGKYASRVQIYTVFGLPYRTLYLTCGGDNYSIYPLE